MNLTNAIFRSTLGRKYLMAVTGAALVVFVIGHLAGNLQIYGPPELINSYGEFLHSKPAVLWAARLGLLLFVGIHIWSAISLSQDNKAARPIPYETWNPTVASYASRTMLMTGLIVAAFIVYHLLHFTVQVEGLNFTGQDFRSFSESSHSGGERHDVYRMMIVGFRQPLISIFYVVAVGLLCLHLSHGVSAMFQSLGLKNLQTRSVLDKAAKVFAALLFLGYASIPVAVLLGLGKEIVN